VKSEVGRGVGGDPPPKKESAAIRRLRLKKDRGRGEVQRESVFGE
jgi:hypothetical protein